jgi:hypothetical protein
MLQRISCRDMEFSFKSTSNYAMRAPTLFPDGSMGSHISTSRKNLNTYIFLVPILLRKGVLELNSAGPPPPPTKNTTQTRPDNRDNKTKLEE